MSKIKRGVSLYSYQQTYHSHQLDLEGCIKAVADLNCDGVEIISEMMIPKFPNPPTAWVDNWFSLMDKYKTKPICYDAFMDGWVYDRLVTDEEAQAQMDRDIELAYKLGFKVIRVLGSVPHDIVERSLDLAAKKDIILASEMHVPDILDEQTLEYYTNVYKRYGETKYFGITMDLGCFMQRPLFIHEEQIIRKGARRDVVNMITEMAVTGVPQEEAINKIRELGGNGLELEYVGAEGASYGSAYRSMEMVNKPETIIPYIPYIRHIHGKFYEMDESCRETTIPNDEIVELLKANDWEGYICSEFEGQRYFHDIPENVVDEVEQVRRQHVQLARAIGE